MVMTCFSSVVIALIMVMTLSADDKREQYGGVLLTICAVAIWLTSLLGIMGKWIG